MNHFEEVDKELIQSQVAQETKARRIKYLKGFGITAFFNIVYSAIILDEMQHMLPPNIVEVITLFTVGIAMWGFFLGLGFAAIPRASTNWGNRYVGASLCSAAFISGLFSLLLLLNSLRFYWHLY